MKKLIYIIVALGFLSACEMTNEYRCQCDDPDADEPGTLQTTVEAKDSNEALEECEAEFPETDCKVREE